MPRAESGTIKSEINRQKSRGLGRLRWYCEMCQKQCRDENGFQCHTKSESHLRQMHTFAQSASKLVAGYSAHVENAFLKILKRKGGRQNANNVYKEYISDKNHIHMNATRWKSLTTFLNHLHVEGKAIVEISESGMFAEYVDRNPEEQARREAERKKELEKLTEEEREQRLIEMQMVKALEHADSEQVPNFTELIRDAEQKVSFSLKPAIAPVASIIEPILDQRDNVQTVLVKRKMTNLDSLIEEQDMKLKSQCFTNEGPKKENWISKGLIVKILNKTLLNGTLYKTKGEIVNVHSLFVAEIESDLGKFKIDQGELETVIPSIGRIVRIVNGNYRGEDAILQEIQADNFVATVKLVSGSHKNAIIHKVDYEDICKLV